MCVNAMDDYSAAILGVVEYIVAEERSPLIIAIISLFTRRAPFHFTGRFVSLFLSLLGLKSAPTR